MNTAIDAVNEAVIYIENHLAEKLRISDVSEAIHYSKYHLHRMFTATTGMSMHSYIKRRKLTKAAERLAGSDMPIIEIAQKAGFDSQQAFSTIFKAMYKLPPKRFRDNGEFYPLQLVYEFEKYPAYRDYCFGDIRYAAKNDISSWMQLAHMAVDGFPCWEAAVHRKVLKDSICQRRAFILPYRSMAVGSMIVNYDTGDIDFLGIHPLYKNVGIDEMFVDFAGKELFRNRPVRTTTYREGDKADTGYRESLINMGFQEAELLTEFGYPTQRFVRN